MTEKELGLYVIEELERIKYKPVLFLPINETQIQINELIDRLIDRINIKMSMHN